MEVDAMQDNAAQVGFAFLVGAFVAVLVCRCAGPASPSLGPRAAAAAPRITTRVVAPSCRCASRPSRPPGSEPTTGLPENSMHLYWDVNFGGGAPHRIRRVTSRDQGAPQNFRDQKFLRNIRDDMSSLKWNLPPGVAVVFYQHAPANGRRLTVWGRGQIRSLRSWGFNDNVSRWAWYSVEP
jgi:hypothetical protein